MPIQQLRIPFETGAICECVRDALEASKEVFEGFATTLIQQCDARADLTDVDFYDTELTNMSSGTFTLCAEWAANYGCGDKLLTGHAPHTTAFSIQNNELNIDLPNQQLCIPFETEAICECVRDALEASKEVFQGFAATLIQQCDVRADLTEVDFSDVELTTMSSGTFTLCAEWNANYGCRDQLRTGNAPYTITFRIQNNELAIDLPNEPSERSTFDEF